MATSKAVIATADFWMATGQRALRTFAQTLIALTASDGANLISGNLIDWTITALGTAALSVLTSIVVGIPEAPNDVHTDGPATPNA